MPSIVRIERESHEAWALIPQLLDRIGAFVVRFDPETNPEELKDLIRTWFVVGDRRLGLWAIVEEETVVGHLLATPEPIGSDVWRYCLLRQAETNTHMNIHRISKQVFNQLIEWTKSMGLDRIVIVTHRDMDAMTRAWGFELYKKIAVLSLKERL